MCNSRSDSAELQPTLPLDPCAAGADRSMLDVASLRESLALHHPEIAPDTFRLMRELSVAHLLLMTTTDSILRAHGLSWSKMFVLLWLRATRDAGVDGLAPSDLSDCLTLTRNTISALLNGLERQGYISRELNRDDKRRFVMRLTPAGDAITQACAGPLFARLDAVTHQIDPTQRQTLLQGLSSLQDILSHEIRAQDDVSLESCDVADR